MILVLEVKTMETKNVILELRTKKGLSQDELAEKVIQDRQFHAGKMVKLSPIQKR